MRDVPAASTQGHLSQCQSSGDAGEVKASVASLALMKHPLQLSEPVSSPDSRRNPRFSAESWTEATPEPRVECTLAEAKRSLFTEPEQARSVFQSRSLGT